MLSEFFADVTFRECIAAMLGLSLGLLLLVGGSMLAEAVGRRRAAHGTSADCYDEAFSSDDHYIGHRDRFRA
jgi:hypothetical protein